LVFFFFKHTVNPDKTISNLAYRLIMLVWYIKKSFLKFFRFFGFLVTHTTPQHVWKSPKNVAFLGKWKIRKIKKIQTFKNVQGCGAGH
jgi:hypothetical protein